MMTSRLRVAALLALALVPSACLVWTWREMPHFGVYHDDTIYTVVAKNLAEGNGYRIASLPDQPWQTKYPPLFSALLAGLWKLNPAFPQNLTMFMVCMWLVLPFYLLVLRALYRSFGLSDRECWLLVFLAAVNPMVCLFSMSIMSDLLFMVMFLTCLMIAERSLKPDTPAWWALAAGVIAGFAYLTRTAALPIAATVPLCLVFRKQIRRAVLFVVGILPAVIGWQLWVSQHMTTGGDLVSQYYTNYMALQRATVHADNIIQVLWYNLDGLFRSAGTVLVFDVALIENLTFQRVIGVAAFAGAIRLSRRSGLLQYPLAALGICGLLLPYHCIADQRLMFPLYPILAAGFWTELKNVLVALKAAMRKGGADRAVAYGFGTLLAALMLVIIGSYAAGDIITLPKLFTKCQNDLNSRRAAYQWLAANSPAQASVYAYDDPLVYLYAGRRACGNPLPPRFYYHNDPQDLKQNALSVSELAQRHRLDYVLLTPDEFYRDIRGPDTAALLEAAAHDPKLVRAYDNPRATIYRRVN
ncbi:MAG TPA: hypothetical protein VKU01_08765 [Bryobacteraceae bacterium]|nr:hypothetical protein [Bryobacteraceae bacterium]